MRIKKSIRRAVIIILIVLLVGALAFGGYIAYKKFSETKTVKEKEIINKIDGYGYYLEEGTPKVYEDLYNELTKVLNQEEIDEESYAKLIAQMLVFDFYNLNSKMSKNDVGGTQFVLESYRNNFVLQASETVYKYIEHNVYGNRKQKLPQVSSVEVSDISTNGYKYNDIIDESAYIIKVNVSYEEDLGYPSEVVVKLVHTKLEDEKIKLEAFYIG